MAEWFENFADTFRLNFVEGERWRWLIQGLKNTLVITFFAVLMGIVIGIVVASIRSTYDMNKEVFQKRSGFFLQTHAVFEFPVHRLPDSYSGDACGGATAHCILRHFCLLQK